MPGTHWLFTGGTVRSPHDGWQPHGALAVTDDQIVALGTVADLRHGCPAGTRTIDLAGGCLLPGFTDSHVHLLGHALAQDRLPAHQAASLPDLQCLLRERVRNTPPATWILGRGWDETRWPHPALPTRAALDVAAPDHPVLLHRVCGHIAVANSAALKAAAITAATPDPAGGRIDRRAGGEPCGILREEAIDQVRQAVPPLPLNRKAELLDRAVAECHQLGICHVQTDDVGSAGGLEAALKLYQRAANPEQSPLRVTLMLPVQHLDAALHRLSAAGSQEGWQDGWLRPGHVKIFADGSLGGRTAALADPYADAPATDGLLLYPPSELTEMVIHVHRLGRQLGIHAIGDRAAAVVLDAMAAAIAAYPRSDHRHRLIHCQVLAPAERLRAARLGVVGDIQPIFLNGDARWYRDRLGPERSAWAYAWRSLLGAGMSCCGGSDAPIEPLNPLLGIQCALTRRDLKGYPAQGCAPDEVLTAAQALHLYTAGAAHATFAESWSGHLATGMVADLVVLDRDPFMQSPERMGDLQVQFTMVGGCTAYRA